MIKFELCPPSHLWIYPIQNLGSGFALYLDLVRAVGGTFIVDNGSKRYKIPMSSFDSFVADLEANAFQPKLSLDVLAAVRSDLTRREEQIDAASSRSEDIDQQLRTRGLQLYPYQKEGIEQLAGVDNWLLADQPGLGKTLQALLAAPAGYPAIVICPAIAKGVWEAEAAKWRPDFKVSVLEGRTSFRWPVASELIVINYDILPPTQSEINAADKDLKDAEKLQDQTQAAYTKRLQEPIPMGDDEAKLREEALEACLKSIASCNKKLADLKHQFVASTPQPGTTLISDECHALKGSSRRSARFISLSRAVRSRKGRTWALSGTPLLNRPSELWKLLSCFDLATRAFGSYPTFLDLFKGTKGTWGGMVWGKPDASVPERMARVSLRRLRAEVLPQLPVKTWRYQRVKLDKVTQKLCDEAASELEKVGIDFDDVTALTKLTAAKGAGFELLAKARLALAACKLPFAIEVIEQLEEQEEPVLVFASHRAPIDVLAKREGWAAITGSTTEANRKLINEQFQAGKLRGLALTIQAGGTALTLTRASQVVFIDRAWTPAMNEQAEDRACRIGTTRGVLITILEANHAIDYRVNQLLLQKQTLINETLGDKKK